MTAFFLCLAAVGLPAQDRDAPFEPPAASQPARFGGAIGVFRISASATPTTVPVGGTVLLSVRITAEGKVLSPPTRPPLDRVPDPDQADKKNPFTEDFYVEAADPAAKHPDDRTWEFFYLLKPKSTTVTEIPDVPFCYFDPAFGQNPQGYQTRYSDAIPLQVTLAAPPPIGAASRAAPMPDSVLSLVRGEEVLRHQQPWSLPSAVVLALLLLAPPLACLVWYLTWQRLYPDVARQTRRRRSRAARLALQTLEGVGSLPPERRAEHIANAVSLFLRRRLDLPEAPTPAEAAAVLLKAGGPEEVRRQASAFFETCDALRFAPDPAPATDDLCAAATALVLAVEAQPWSSHPS